MAKKKVTKKDEEKKVEVEVTETVDVKEEPVEEVVVEEKAEDILETVEVEEPKEAVEIKEEAVQDNRPVKKDVKIKMARNHKCHIGGELYDLKEGQTYNVPEFVKMILANAGVLSPL